LAAQDEQELESYTIWNEFASEPGNQLHQVHVLIVDGFAPPLTGFLQSLFGLCPRTRRLIFTNAQPTQIHNYLPSIEIHPGHPNNIGRGPDALLPELEEIILELQGEIPDEIVEDIIEQWLSIHLEDLCDSRREIGVTSQLKSLTVRVFSKTRAGFVEDYPEEDGTLLRYEVVSISPTKGHSRLESDLWLP